MGDAISGSIPQDRILISDLLVRCIIGVNESERTSKQDVLINLSLWTDLRPAGKSDDFAQAIDYRSIKKRIFEMAESSQFFLVEAMAERVAEICLGFPGVQRVRVMVEKPSALRYARSVGVEILRERA